LAQEDPDPGRQKLPTKNNEISWSEELDASHLMAFENPSWGPKEKNIAICFKIL
jgi:hypothetical protein